MSDEKEFTLEHHTGLYLSAIVDNELVFEAEDIKSAHTFKNEDEAHKCRFDYLHRGFGNYSIIVEVNKTE